MLFLVGALTAITLALWPSDDSDLEAAGAATTSSTTEPNTTTEATTTTEGTTTTAPTTTEAPATTARPSSTAGPTTAPPTTRPTTTTTAPPPPFRSSIENVTAAQLGSSYQPGLGCAEPDALRALNLTHWGYDGAVHEGRIIVAASEAENVIAAFRDIYAARFPIERMVPVDRYGADDQASMRDNNTSGYNCRTVAGSTTLSNHAFGKAVDINPLHNPYVKGDSIDPPEGAPWADRKNRRPGMIYAGDAVVNAFAARGWSWGGYWGNPDYQHFDK